VQSLLKKEVIKFGMHNHKQYFGELLSTLKPRMCKCIL